jgi:hypothetical protein
MLDDFLAFLKGNQKLVIIAVAVILLILLACKGNTKLPSPVEVTQP